MDPLKPSPSLLCKIGSAIAHVQEAAGGDGHAFDLIAAKECAKDPEVAAWLASMRALALLPEPRTRAKKGRAK